MRSSLFVVASLTDWLDGYLARKVRHVSFEGTLIAPIQSKMILVVLSESLVVILSPVPSFMLWGAVCGELFFVRCLLEIFGSGLQSSVKRFQGDFEARMFFEFLLLSMH
jgi:phosphatidylglycerophosphate synthase